MSYNEEDMQEVARGADDATVTAYIPVTEEGLWRVDWRLEKWNRNEDFEAGLSPDEVMTFEDNLLVNTGIQLLEDLLIGAGGTAFTTGGNAYLGVGTSNTAASA